MFPSRCPALKACLDLAISAGEIDRHDLTSDSLGAPARDGFMLNLTFAVFYFVFLACCATGSQVGTQLYLYIYIYI